MKIGKDIYVRVFFLILFVQLLKPLQASSVSTGVNFDIFSQENGLPNNQIQCIYQDSRGWIWIGTSHGLSRFDGYNFVNFISNPNDPNSLRGGLVRVITEDKSGNLLIGTENGGLNIFDREKERFSHPYKNHKEFAGRDVSVNDIETDQYGQTWIGTDFNIFVIDTLGVLSAIYPEYSNLEMSFKGNFVRNMRFDKRGTLWIGTNNGVFIYGPSTGFMESLELPFDENPNKQIETIFLDDDGLVWIGTYSSGIFIVDPATKKINKITLSPDVERSELVRAITKDALGEYWIGTRAGLYVYSKNRGFTGFYRHDERKPRSLSNNSVQAVFHDTQGEIWVGTRKGLNLLAKSKRVFHSFTALPGDNQHLNSSSVYALWVDGDRNIWVGTEDGGINIYNPASGKFTYMKHEEGDRNSISENCIKALREDGKGNLWVGTFLGGVDVIHLKTGKISHFKHNPDVPGTISSNEVWDICIDGDGEVWIASSGGVDKYLDASNTFLHYPQINGDESVNWIEIDSNDNMWFGSLNEIIIYNSAENAIKRYFERSRSMYEDSKNRIWVATRDNGIALYTASGGALKYFNESDGLPNNEALCIEEDNDNNLWISTTNGLSKFDPENGFFRNFTSNDGLINNQFCYRSSFKNDTGELLFGSVSGFNIFNPEEVESQEPDIPIVFTDLKIFNKSTPIGDEQDAVLHKSISETEHLTLSYNQDVITFEFAALNYVNSDKNLYTYKLEGFNSDWNEPSKMRSATYTNLNPGDYVLRIKRFLPGVENDVNELQLRITILPPFWKTIWFFVILVLFVISLIYIIVQLILNREKIKYLLVLEKANARNLHEIDMMKLKFFTNISHEVRTPLTMILGPINKLLQKDYSKEEIRENLQLVLRNAQKLDKLVSQLLDFRKLQTGKLKLNLTESDIVSFTREIVNSFNEFAEEKEITLKFNTLKRSLNAAFDPDKIEKILDNLLSNAFKYTAQGGAITVNLSLVFDSNNNDFNETQKEKQFIEITVKDTGKGIAENNLNRIFQRFFQSDTEDENDGFGIGLALVKELVEVHNGDIFVNSKQGKGAKFTIRIPYYSNVQVKPDESEVHTIKETNLAEPFFDTDEGGSNVLNSSIMLIVEDNADVRKFISGHFISTYKIIEAKDGEEGWKTALEIIPDIIISDILMPVSNGYELCKRLKSDERTSHIPVLLLTALHSRENEIKGLTTGADDFITKPFDLSVLQAKVENILSIRESLKQKFMRTVFLEPKNVEISSPDERFLQKAINLIESNISNSDLDIESFAVLIGVSRMQLYRKIHALTDMTVKEFIRHIRLKRAAQLLVQNKMNISEVAYGVGFKDLSHFRKCFKREYRMSASEYIAKNRQSGLKNILKKV